MGCSLVKGPYVWEGDVLFSKAACNLGLPIPDDWRTERLSNGVQLGESLHLQADVMAGGHIPLRLFVDDCVATLSPDRNSSPRYALIDLSG